MGFSKKPADNRAADPAPASASASQEPSSTSSLSFFSRFTLPLRSRARYIADFHIRPAEPHRKYGAGDQVQGAVVLTVVKPVRITHLVVSLHGHMRVYKGLNAPTNEPIIDPAEALTTSSRGSRHKHLGNGCVRLFQDEQTLSGDGRLEPGKYEFNFNLLFPANGLPSSIDFERGTISYMITATLTRPTSIGTKTAPKTSCERKLYLVEKLDIGSLAPPRPRTIYLEPISKRPKKKKPVAVSVEKAPVAIDGAVPISEPDSSRANENSTEGSLSVIGEDLEHELTGNNPRSPQSDVRSVSSESAVSGSTGQSRAGDANYAVATTPSLAGKKVPAVKERTITATVELPKGGCLRGDMVPIKISVQHIRRIKSMHGVIVTLYRLGRIDSSPPLLSKELPEAEARRLEKEEYYPRSKTGLGGLSLSSAGSCSVFRKDLSQAFAPLIIDPDTLTANLTASVRVPEDVFPTIKGAPYEMISFKYHVEVIVDLGGKLANQIHGIKPSGTRVSPVAGPLGLTGNPYEGGPATMTSWSSSIIDTDGLRRQKGVICVVFEVVVGTADSSRLRAKAPAKPNSFVHNVPVLETDVYDGDQNEKQPWPNAPEDGNGYPSDEFPQDYSPSPHFQAPQPYPYWGTSSPQHPPAPHYIPPPDIPDDTHLTDKERIRRAEQRLLPSQPPEAPVAGHSNSHLANGENIYDADDQIPTPVAGPSDDVQPSNPTRENYFGAPSAPALEDLSSNTGAHTNEDKQELERRRLLAEAGAPPECPEDYDNGGSSSAAASAPAAEPSAPPSHDLQPSAPVLEDEGAYGPHYTYGTAGTGTLPLPASRNVAEPEEPLPKYER
ncbi:hypothetical protein CHGG_01481 [Chaetomium globosum CBS 148.51]|uniref:Arrestin C-terminal-like domain-containing protein n=1 Tax=Chaetomium globosum (strain ATCC 6205 / CBS 148.51 / DSM 1962 / NBRC 6347 / NRRL 1970) TaxID=306901 RepID=Q2HE73_CHAGB|nr:uncharacterized protein CHGG_01481 [Chaetomium globosum CBS 148.51]EAQ93246.1 hypothetical protein CHGG_01481 [Chaetomium globosum CBS 148.51]